MPYLKNVYKSFDGLDLFSGFSISFEQNKINCILGPSGCGKSTLLNLLAGTVQPDKGEIGGLPSEISYVFQEPRLLPWKTVRKNIEFVLKDRMPDEELKDRTNKYLKIVEMENFSENYVTNLSGGMKQRVSLARAFSYKSGLILMDEPFNSLDFKLKKNVSTAFLKLWEKDKRTVVFVTHDIDEAVETGHSIFLFSVPPVQILKKFDTSDYPDKLLLKKEIIEII